jgi:hypothetical protein
MKQALALAFLTAGLADAASADLHSADLLRGLSSDGVFRQVTPLPADRVQKGERGYDLLPGQFGGQWSVVLGGAQNVASSVHFTFLGGRNALEQSGPTIGKLMGRMVGRAATSCFSLGNERLPELKSWIEGSVRAATADTNLERNFGPLRVQLLIFRTQGPDAPSGRTDLDVLMGRTGTPGVSPWANSCTKQER